MLKIKEQFKTKKIMKDLSCASSIISALGESKERDIGSDLLVSLQVQLTYYIVLPGDILKVVGLP